MSRLGNIGYKKAVRAFERAGWQILRQKSSHIVLRKAGFPNIVIPAHKEVSPYLLLSQIKRAGMTVDEFLRLIGK